MRSPVRGSELRAEASGAQLHAHGQDSLWPGFSRLLVKQCPALLSAHLPARG